MIDERDAGGLLLPDDARYGEIVDLVRQGFICTDLQGTLELGQDDAEVGDRYNMRIWMPGIETLHRRVHTR